MHGLTKYVLPYAVGGIGTGLAVTGFAMKTYGGNIANAALKVVSDGLTTVSNNVPPTVSTLCKFLPTGTDWLLCNKEDLVNGLMTVATNSTEIVKQGVVTAVDNTGLSNGATYTIIAVGTLATVISAVTLGTYLYHHQPGAEQDNLF